MSRSHSVLPGVFVWWPHHSVSVSATKFGQDIEYSSFVRGKSFTYCVFYFDCSYFVEKDHPLIGGFFLIQPASKKQ
jgi:hypothetical protein